jgi:hypothetical protein
MATVSSSPAVGAPTSAVASESPPPLARAVADAGGVGSSGALRPRQRRAVAPLDTAQLTALQNNLHVLEEKNADWHDVETILSHAVASTSAVGGVPAAPASAAAVGEPQAPADPSPPRLAAAQPAAPSEPEMSEVAGRNLSAPCLTTADDIAAAPSAALGVLSLRHRRPTNASALPGTPSALPETPLGPAPGPAPPPVTEILQETLAQEVSMDRIEGLLVAPGSLLLTAVMNAASQDDVSVVGQALLKIFGFHRLGKRLIVQQVQRELQMPSTEPESLFRGHSFAAYFISMYLRGRCTDWLVRLLQPIVVAVCVRNLHFEVDERRLANVSDIDANRKQLVDHIDKFVADVVTAVELFPQSVKGLFHVLQNIIDQRFSGMGSTIIGSFFFLRFVCAALVTPRDYDLVKQSPSAGAQRSLILLSKVLQNISNQLLFGDKETYLQFMNPYLEKHFEKISRSLKRLSVIQDRKLADAVDVAVSEAEKNVQMRRLALFLLEHSAAFMKSLDSAGAQLAAQNVKPSQLYSWVNNGLPSFATLREEFEVPVTDDITSSGGEDSIDARPGPRAGKVANVAGGGTVRRNKRDEEVASLKTALEAERAKTKALEEEVGNLRSKIQLSMQMMQQERTERYAIMRELRQLKDAAGIPSDQPAVGAANPAARPPGPPVTARTAAGQSQPAAGQPVYTESMSKLLVNEGDEVLPNERANPDLNLRPVLRRTTSQSVRAQQANSILPKVQLRKVDKAPPGVSQSAVPTPAPQARSPPVEKPEIHAEEEKTYGLSAFRKRLSRFQRSGSTVGTDGVAPPTAESTAAPVERDIIPRREAGAEEDRVSLPAAGSDGDGVASEASDASESTVPSGRDLLPPRDNADSDAGGGDAVEADGDDDGDDARSRTESAGHLGDPSDAFSATAEDGDDSRRGSARSRKSISEPRERRHRDKSLKKDGKDGKEKKKDKERGGKERKKKEKK